MYYHYNILPISKFRTKRHQTNAKPIGLLSIGMNIYENITLIIFPCNLYNIYLHIYIFVNVYVYMYTFYCKSFV